MDNFRLNYWFAGRYDMSFRQRTVQVTLFTAVIFTAGAAMANYVRNNPLNATDPTGMDAYIKVWSDNRVEIRIPMEWSGDANTPQNVAAIKANIEAGWSGTFGKYTVTTSVVEPSAGEFTNRGMINNGPTDSKDNAGHAYVLNNGTLHMPVADITGAALPNGTTSVKGGDTPKHEGGHLMGLPDQDGSHGNIMDKSHSTRVTEQTVTSIINAPQNTVQHCDASTGKCQ